MPLNDERIVVVGASLAGFRAAETLRESGYYGPITLIGEEPHRTYDRPPLSKQILTGEWGIERAFLPAAAGDEEQGIDWVLGRVAVSLDLDDRRVTLDDG